MKKRIAKILPVLAAEVLLAAACTTKEERGQTVSSTTGCGTPPSSPATRACADAFETVNPGLKIRITQYGWDDYWSKLTAGFIAEQTPDVFTNHLTKYAQFVDLQVLVPLDDLEATHDVDDSEYVGNLAELWKGRDGKRYGIPRTGTLSPISTTRRSPTQLGSAGNS